MNKPIYHVNRPLSSVGIVAMVRPDGSFGGYTRKVFDLMLCPLDDQDKQLKEAKRILRQIGYQFRSVCFDPVPGN